MKPYPSIPHVSDSEIGKQCFTFLKYDGNNLRSEWSNKSGWYKFGTRTRLFDHTNADYGEAIDLFNKTFAKELDLIFRKQLRITNVIVYYEFFGKNSFAGQHVKEDEKELVLFDVNIYKQGFVNPQNFIKLFSNVVPTAKLLYDGELTQEIVNQVKNGEFPVDEGVICKGGDKHNLWMCKIKTNQYLEKLKSKFKEKWQIYV